ncbi:bifunctional 2-polyprenyl-6-hydroxyphenol methylase/3-demethylubiquinol 3-O-methyltransferase UbiG [Lacinutrix sp. Hel_I_90]|uniref:class I SAM-dependent methyltransferase n=1 Tax=Lacinutrix sp. Hel_I_90 TaxID=1249999 RepID=UPI0006968203|nr:class I SAM-dependent methyltransferase [Lacinutrix sp. Hel_I_90]
MDFSPFTPKQNVYYLTAENNTFSRLYLIVRDKEQRVLTDAQVKKLPHLNLYEWRLRKKSTERFANYIASKNTALKILDIGCGNGWFSNKIVEVSDGNEVIGLDVNREELEQAARIFHKTNLYFVYADIFKISEFFKAQFDIITLNGSIQYFENFDVLMSVLKSFLKPKGEIHIIDSPFYKASEISMAKERTKAYYTKLGVPEMAANYFHHSISEIKEFEVLYKYKNKIINKVLRKKDSPFSWYRYTK